MMPRKTLLAGAGVVALLAACGGSTPTNTPPPTTPPAAVPTPTPLPDASEGCLLPPMPNLALECPVVPPVYSGNVNDAVQKLFTTRPELFNFSDVKGDGLFSYKVLDRRKYTRAVVLNLRQQGLCAIDELEEIAVKKTQEFHEQYNVWTSDGYVRLPPGAYITTCIPAQF
jgi:hypothetical protein